MLHFLRQIIAIFSSNEHSCRWDMKEVEKLNGCYSDFARFMFGTMIEIENALPKDTGRRNVNFIRAIVGVNSSLLSTLIPIYKISQFSFDLFVFYHFNEVCIWVLYFFCT